MIQVKINFLLYICLLLFIVWIQEVKILSESEVLASFYLWYYTENIQGVLTHLVYDFFMLIRKEYFLHFSLVQGPFCTNESIRVWHLGILFMITNEIIWPAFGHYRKNDRSIWYLVQIKTTVSLFPVQVITLTLKFK